MSVLLPASEEAHPSAQRLTRAFWTTRHEMDEILHRLRIRNQHLVRETASRLGNLVTNPYVHDSGHCSRVHCWV